MFKKKYIGSSSNCNISSSKLELSFHKRPLGIVMMIAPTTFNKFGTNNGVNHVLQFRFMKGYLESNRTKEPKITKPLLKMISRVTMKWRNSIANFRRAWQFLIINIKFKRKNLSIPSILLKRLLMMIKAIIQEDFIKIAMPFKTWIKIFSRLLATNFKVSMDNRLKFQWNRNSLMD